MKREELADFLHRRASYIALFGECTSCTRSSFELRSYQIHCDDIFYLEFTLVRNSTKGTSNESLVVVSDCKCILHPWRDESVRTAGTSVLTSDPNWVGTCVWPGSTRALVIFTYLEGLYFVQETNIAGIQGLKGIGSLYKYVWSEREMYGHDKRMCVEIGGEWRSNLKFEGIWLFGAQ